MDVICKTGNGYPLRVVSFFCKKCDKFTDHDVQIKKSIELKVDGERLTVTIRWCQKCKTRSFGVFDPKEWLLIQKRMK